MRVRRRRTTRNTIIFLCQRAGGQKQSIPTRPGQTTLTGHHAHTSLLLEEATVRGVRPLAVTSAKLGQTRGSHGVRPARGSRQFPSLRTRGRGNTSRSMGRLKTQTMRRLGATGMGSGASPAMGSGAGKGSWGSRPLKQSCGAWPLK